MDLTPLRFLISALTLALYFVVTKRRLVLSRADAPKVFATVALGYAAYVSLLNLGRTSVPAGTTSLLLNTSPIFVFAFAYFVLGERSLRQGTVGMAIAVVGMVAVTVFGSSTVGFDWNALTILVAALILAVFLNFQQLLFTKVAPAEMVFWGCPVSRLLTLPFARFDLKLETWTLSTHFAFAVLVIFGTVLACVFWNISLSATRGAAGGSLLFAIPVFSALLGWLRLGQVPSVAAIVGGAFAPCGVVLLGRAQAVHCHPSKTVASV